MSGTILKENQFWTNRTVQRISKKKTLLWGDVYVIILNASQRVIDHNAESHSLQDKYTFVDFEKE